MNITWSIREDVKNSLLAYTFNYIFDEVDKTLGFDTYFTFNIREKINEEYGIVNGYDFIMRKPDGITFDTFKRSLQERLNDVSEDIMNKMPEEIIKVVNMKEFKKGINIRLSGKARKAGLEYLNIYLYKAIGYRGLNIFINVPEKVGNDIYPAICKQVLSKNLRIVTGIMMKYGLFDKIYINTNQQYNYKGKTIGKFFKIVTMYAKPPYSTEEGIFEKVIGMTKEIISTLIEPALSGIILEDFKPTLIRKEIYFEKSKVVSPVVITAERKGTQWYLDVKLNVMVNNSIQAPPHIDLLINNDLVIHTNEVNPLDAALPNSVVKDSIVPAIEKRIKEGIKGIVEHVIDLTFQRQAEEYITSVLKTYSGNVFSKMNVFTEKTVTVEPAKLSSVVPQIIAIKLSK